MPKQVVFSSLNLGSSYYKFNKLQFLPEGCNPPVYTNWEEWVWLTVREGGGGSGKIKPVCLRFCLSVRPAQLKAVRFQGQFSVVSLLPLIWGIMRTSMCVFVCAFLHPLHPMTPLSSSVAALSAFCITISSIKDILFVAFTDSLDLTNGKTSAPGQL